MLTIIAIVEKIAIATVTSLARGFECRRMMESAVHPTMRTEDTMVTAAAPSSPAEYPVTKLLPAKTYCGSKKLLLVVGTPKASFPLVSTRAKWSRCCVIPARINSQRETRNVSEADSPTRARIKRGATGIVRDCYGVVRKRSWRKECEADSSLPPLFVIFQNLSYSAEDVLMIDDSL